MSRNVLRSPRQFRLVYERGEKVNGKCAVLFYHFPVEAGERPLFGVVASKRVGGAVQRNRAKRLLRQAVRAAAGQLVRADMWAVLVAKKSILECTSREVERDLVGMMMGEGLIRGVAPD